MQTKHAPSAARYMCQNIENLSLNLASLYTLTNRLG